ncbi:MAG: valine--tRNA ligase [Clostridia bacterium]|nr:valine--tRNA ligase [Clostridia bacterium]
MENKFNPKDYEKRIYKEWMENGYFTAKPDVTKIPYTIVIPPPNVTSQLHIGHALVNTLQDILIRTKRMQGYNALWIPGTDHASIATEAKLVQKLASEGIKKEDLGRENFLEEAWAWTAKYGGTIISQLKELGCSCDWSRERFTMDEGLSKAVEYVFIKLYKKGLIYKGERMINWCPTCKTSISDAEVEYEDKLGHLWYIKYKVKDSSDFVIVATTRPETLLGDTAVAVNPKDERYSKFIGKTVILPLIGREIPVIGDEYVDIEFGTGALKITPAHDPNDFEIGQKHNLDIIKVFTDDGKINYNGGKYEELDRYEAREVMVKDLQKEGTLIKIEEYNHNVGTCYRCHKDVEPAISNQWFVKMDGLAKPAIDVVKNGQIKFIPERHEKTYYNWMENIKDWCISRQLWWGHRIPAYYCECGNIMVTSEMPDKCDKCGSTEIKQDEDVLDTWFSSALWPFSTMGWPEQTEDFKYFYPTNVLVTGYDIIFFWVARMIFSGLEYTGQIPFRDVLMHGLVRDAQGRKMSKSLGNGVDPVEVIDKYGADVLRLSLTLNISLANDIKYSEEKLELSRNFLNKIWNASKFVISNMDMKEIFDKVDSKKFTVEDKWILSKLNELIKDVTICIDKYDIGIAVQKIYDFLWFEFCDWYIEMVKSRLYDEKCENKLEAEYVLYTVLNNSLKLLHPYAPFVTEEIYQTLNSKNVSIMVSDWPLYKEEYDYKKEESAVEVIKDIVKNVRNLKANMNVAPSKKTSMIFVTTTKKELIKDSIELLKKLINIESYTIVDTKINIDKKSVSIIVPEIEIYIPLGDLVDFEQEKIRIENEIKKYEAEILRVDNMLANKGFVEKAPEQKIAEEKEKRDKYIEMLNKAKERLATL